MPKNRMPRGLVALGASAVAAIYVVGYARTQSADASIDAIATAVATAPPTAAATTQPTAAINQRQRSAAATSTSTSTAATPTVAPTAPSASTAPTTAQQAQPSYRDGTYSGMGTSRRGNVWVSVTIQGGRIELVSITRSTLQYPVRDIAGLPAQVVGKQSSQVDIVSGATYSSQAFRTAVSQALQEAAA
jgi:uncharacterized protein with FMN-binding domain